MVVGTWVQLPFVQDVTVMTVVPTPDGVSAAGEPEVMADWSGEGLTGVTI